MNCNINNMLNMQDDDYGFFYDIEDEYKENVKKQRHSPATYNKNYNHDTKYIDKLDKGEVLYKGSNYLLGLITVCITVASFYEIFS